MASDPCLKQTHSHSQSNAPEKVRPEVGAGLSGTPSAINKYLRKTGIDPERLSILHLGRPSYLRKHRVPPWVVRMAMGYILWLVLLLIDWLFQRSAIQ